MRVNQLDMHHWLKNIFAYSAGSAAQEEAADLMPMLLCGSGVWSPKTTTVQTNEDTIPNQPVAGLAILGLQIKRDILAQTTWQIHIEHTTRALALGTCLQHL